VSKLKAVRADLVYWGGLDDTGGLILRQMRDGGVQAPLIGGDGIASDEFATIAGPSAEGTLMTYILDPRTRPEATAVVQKFRAKNLEPQGYTLYSYAAVEIIKQAAEAAKSVDPKKVAERIKSGMKFNTVIGELSYDKKGDLTRIGYVLYIWKKGADGKITYVEAQFPNQPTTVVSPAPAEQNVVADENAFFDYKQNYCETLLKVLSASSTPNFFRYADNDEPVSLSTVTPALRYIHGRFFVSSGIVPGQECGVYNNRAGGYYALSCMRVVSANRLDTFEAVYNQTLKDMRDCLLPAGWKEASVDQGACVPKGTTRGECERPFNKGSRIVWLFSNSFTSGKVTLYTIGIQTKLGK
jgi:hypothetical protein